MNNKQMKLALKNATNEKDVENTYRAALSGQRPSAVWQSPHNTDGLALWKPELQPQSVRMLLEAKFDQDFTDTAQMCNVLGQMLFYLKKFERAGEELPNVLFVGDRNECFALSTDVVRNFLAMKIDWTVAPSKGNPQLVQALVQGMNILPFVEKIDEHFDFAMTLGKIEVLAQGVKQAVKATPANISAMFEHWRHSIFRKPDGKIEKRAPLNASDEVGVFLDALFRPTDVYLHPQLFNVLVAPGHPNGVPIDAKKYKAFFSHFAQGYKQTEKDALYAMKDRLVEDKARREQGAFFTPRLWVDEAHKTIEAVLGESWRRDCVVWDPAAGTGNLTRDHYDWGCLISSTCERSDVEIMRRERWGGEVFQHDLLNPDGPSLFMKPEELNTIPAKVEQLLREGAQAGKRLVFFMNPPYGTAGNGAAADGTSKEGIAQTLINDAMKNAKLGACSQQLYAQFMFRCKRLGEYYGYGPGKVVVAQFSKSTFVSSGAYKPFREWWLSKMAFNVAFLFQASHFADVSGAWGVFFSVWTSKALDPGAKTPSRGREFTCTLKDIDDFKVVDVGEKIIYNSDGREASEWVRAPVKKLKGVDAPQMSSGLVVKEEGRGSALQGHLLYMVSGANSVMKSGFDCALLALPYNWANGFSVLPSNWRRAIALYGARKLVTGTWVNDKDEYLVPDEHALGYDQWVDDLHVYALLHASTNCTAMRDVPYKGKSWRIKNHFFWRTRAEMIELLDAPETPQLYRDAKMEPLDKSTAWGANGDAYLAYLLSTGLRDRLSPDVRALLDALDALMVDSLKHRENFAAGREDLHLTAWDAGVYQLKTLWQEAYDTETVSFPYQERYKTIRNSYHKVSERLREGVFTYGFLRK